MTVSPIDTSEIPVIMTISPAEAVWTFSLPTLLNTYNSVILEVLMMMMMFT
jgi:hypothetical protein